MDVSTVGEPPVRWNQMRAISIGVEKIPAKTAHAKMRRIIRLCRRRYGRRGDDRNGGDRGDGFSVDRID